jgi:hypothetical protein
MMKFVQLLGLVFAIAVCNATEPPSRVERSFGERAGYLGATISYPDFAIRFVEKREKQGPRPYSTDYVFEILDKKTEKKIGSFTFVMSGVYLEPKFDLNGKKYAVEMFCTLSNDSRALGEDEVIVWDERTAKYANPKIYNWMMKSGPNQALLPTPTSVTPPAAQEPRQP